MIQKNRLALGLALALTAPSVFAASALTAVQPGARPASKTTMNEKSGAAPKQPVRLRAVTVSAALDQARNALSPETGSSQYVIVRASIQKMPLGATTPVN